jgi:hypothetical protein
LRSTRDKRSTSALEPARRSVANAVPRRHVRRGVRERCGKAQSTLCPAAPTHAAEASQRRTAAPRVRQLRLQTSVCARCATPPPQRAGATRPEAHSHQNEPRSCALASPAASLTWAAARSRAPCPSPYPLPGARKREQPLASRAQAEPTTAAAAAWRTAAPRSTQRQARPRAGQDGALRVIARDGGAHSRQRQSLSERSQWRRRRAFCARFTAARCASAPPRAALRRPCPRCGAACRVALTAVPSRAPFAAAPRTSTGSRR